MEQMKSALILLLICLTVSSCKEEVTGMYEVQPAPGSKCAFYPIVREDPLTFGKGAAVECPASVFGMHYKETPTALDAVRDLQDKVRSCRSLLPTELRQQLEL